jgi:membrane associated rhomboid family serine protease
MVAALCGVLLGVYAFELGLSLRRGPAELESFLHAWGLVPREFLSGRWFTPVTALFLHAGPVHVGANVAFLAFFGRDLEALLGGRLLLVLFFGSAGVAALLHVATAPASFVTTLGASGAVAGLLGAWWRLRGRRGGPVGGLAGLALLVLWLLAQLAAAATAGGGVAGWAHLGGFAAGWLAAPQLVAVKPRTD